MCANKAVWAGLIAVVIFNPSCAHRQASETTGCAPLEESPFPVRVLITRGEPTKAAYSPSDLDHILTSSFSKAIALTPGYLDKGPLQLFRSGFQCERLPNEDFLGVIRLFRYDSFRDSYVLADRAGLRSSSASILLERVKPGDVLWVHGYYD